MRTSGLLTVCAAAALLLFAPLAGAEPVSSPRYTSWAKCKPGSSVSRTLENRVGPRSTTTDIRHTLLEVTPEKVVLKLEMTITSGGRATPAPPQTIEIPAKMEKYADLLGANIKATFTENRTETVDIAGRSITCRVIDFQGEQVSRTPGIAIKVRGAVWVSEDVPGAIVQILQNAQMTDKDGNIVEGTANTAVASVDIKD